MKKSLSSSLIAIVLLFSANLGSLAQSNPNELKLIETAREIIAEAGVCTLITLDDEGKPRARAMGAFAPDEKFVVWFGTNSKSRKVMQIQQNSNVTLYYFDKASSSYVSIQGQAEIVNDKDMKQKYWKEGWSSFYPNYPDGYSLIKVTPKWLEVISMSRGIVGDSITWQPSAVYFKN